MLEKTYHNYDHRPKVYPFPGDSHRLLDKRKIIRTIKLHDKDLNGINILRDYSNCLLEYVVNERRAEYIQLRFSRKTNKNAESSPKFSMATQVYKITRHDPQPVLIRRPEPILDTSGLALTEKVNVAKKEKGFIPPTPFTPGLTFGVIGDDTNLYPSSQWQSEAQSRYIPSASEKDDKDKQSFLITSLDTRAHNPQSRRLFHIKRISHAPVCQVLTWPLDAQQSGEGVKTIYNTSYPTKVRKEPRRLILRHNLEKRADGIIPFNHPAEGFDVRNEMMLPVCDPVVLPSAPNPHRYLVRKRKVPSPNKPAGVIYPPLEPKPVRSAEIMSKGCKSAPYERVSVSSLAGDVFSRRKYIAPPLANMTTGSVEIRPRTEGHRFNDKYVPFIKCKTIIPYNNTQKS